MPDIPATVPEWVTVLRTFKGLGIQRQRGEVIDVSDYTMWINKREMYGDYFRGSTPQEVAAHLARLATEARQPVEA